MTLTIFYDGFCPLCVAEMRKLKSLDKQQRLAFVDIQAEDFASQYPHLDWQALNNRIHAQWQDGRVISGLDATYHAWKAVGHGWLYAPLRWPLVRWFADAAYNIFARHRYRISYWLTGQQRCTRCQLPSLDNPRD